MILRKIIFILSLSICTTAFAKDYNQLEVDSLWNIYYDDANPDSLRGQSLKILGEKIYRDQLRNLDSAEFCFNTGIEFSKKKSLKDLLAYFHNSLALIQKSKGNFDLAIANFENAIKLSDELNNYGYSAGVRSNLAAVYGQQGDFNRALECLNKSLELLDKENNPKAKISTLFYLAIIYSQLNYYEESAYYYQEILSQYDSLPRDRNYLFALRNLAGIYVKTDKKEQAKKHYELALEKSNESKDFPITRLLTIDMADFYLKSDSIQKADMLYEEALKMEGDAYKDLAYGKYYYGKCLLAKSTGKYKEALKFARESLKIASTLKELGTSSMVYKEIYELNKVLGNTPEALEAFEQYQALLDSNNSIENKEAAIRFQYQLNYKEKQVSDSLNFLQQQEISELNHKAKLEQEAAYRYLLVAMILILILAAALLVQRYLNKRKQLDRTSKKLKHSTKDLAKVAEITKSKKELENDVMEEIQQALSLFESKADQKLVVDIIKKQKWSAVDWKEENLFLEDIASGSAEFEEKLLRKYPDLTKAELELCSYLKAGFTTKKISALRNVSLESVQKAKQRLRKKLNTESGADLYQVMQNID